MHDKASLALSLTGAMLVAVGLWFVDWRVALVVVGAACLLADYLMGGDDK